MSDAKSKVPLWLAQRLGAVVVLAGIGGGTYIAGVRNAPPSEEALRDEYVRSVAADKSTSDAVKVAMVLARAYESSGKHIGTPYVDNLGKGRPMTVCNGITGPEVIVGKTYTPTDCYNLEKRVYQRNEAAVILLTTPWARMTIMQQASVLDFVHNKGVAAYEASTMRKKNNQGDVVGACRENLRWTLGTVNGVKVPLPGLVVRAESNDELCASWTVAGK